MADVREKKLLPKMIVFISGTRTITKNNETFTVRRQGRARRAMRREEEENRLVARSRENAVVYVFFVVRH